MHPEKDRFAAGRVTDPPHFQSAFKGDGTSSAYKKKQLDRDWLLQVSHNKVWQQGAAAFVAAAVISICCPLQSTAAVQVCTIEIAYLLLDIY